MIRRLFSWLSGRPVELPAAPAQAWVIGRRWPAVSLRRRYRPETFSGKTTPPAWIFEAARKSTRYDGPGRKIAMGSR